MQRNRTAICPKRATKEVSQPPHLTSVQSSPCALHRHISYISLPVTGGPIPKEIKNKSVQKLKKHFCSQYRKSEAVESNHQEAQ